MRKRFAEAFRGLEPETHLLTRRAALMLLAVVYVCAFVSVGVQVQGLIGSAGTILSSWALLTLFLYLFGCIGIELECVPAKVAAEMDLGVA